MSEEVAGKVESEAAGQAMAGADAGIVASGETLETLESSAESQQHVATGASPGQTAEGGQAGAPSETRPAPAGATPGEGKGRPPRGPRAAGQGEGGHQASQGDVSSPMGRRLRRLMDEDIDAEIEAAMGDFDGKTLLNSAATGEATQESAPPVPQGRHAEPAQDKRTVRVLSVRGDDVFVELGGKSEGIVPILQFAGKVPNPGDMIDVIVDKYDQASGLQDGSPAGRLARGRLGHGGQGHDRRRPHQEGQQGRARSHGQRHSRLHAGRPG